MHVRAVPVVTLTVGGVPMKMTHANFRITETANGRNRLDCQVYSPDGSSNRPAVGDDVQVVENGVVIFGGIIDTPTEGGVGSEPVVRLITPISAADYAVLAERRVLNLTFAPGTLKSWLQTVAAYLAHWGVIVDPTQEDGPTFADPLVCSFMRVDEVLNQFSTLTNGDYLWEIDFNKHLRMFSPATTPAPFNIVDGDRHVIGDVTVAPSLANYANRVLVLAGDGLHDVTENWTGDGVTTDFPLEYFVSATRGYVTNNPPGHTGPDNNETLGTPPATWAFDNGTASLTRYQVGSNQTVKQAPVAGAAITFIYTAQFPVLKYADAPGGIPDPPGIWEQLVREPKIFDAATAQAHATAYVLAASQVPSTVVYTTQQPGVHPGQVQQIQVSPRHLATQCLITDVTTSDTEGRMYRQVTAVTSSVAPVDTWRSMIKGWNTNVAGSGGTPASIVSGGGGSSGGSGGATISGRVGYLTMITGPNAAGESTLSQSGNVVNVNGGSITGASVVAATTLQGAYDPAQLSAIVPDSKLPANLARTDAASTTFAGNVTVGGSLGVTGPTTLSSLTTTGAATLASLGVTGNTTVGGTLGVTGAATIGGTLGVTGVITAPAFQASPVSGGAPGELYRDGSSGLTLYAATGTGYDFAIRQPSGATLARVPTGTANLELAGNVGSMGYVSSTTGWRITAAGAADFRTLSATELHVQTFVVDQQRALAGGEIIAKSAAVLAADVVLPALNATVTITVQDLAGAPGMQAFAPGDLIMLRYFTRAAGTLTVANALGTVSAPVTGLPGGTQSWTWTYTVAGGPAAGTTISAGGVVLDFGVSGNGYLQLAGADGAYNANGPYLQAVTWTTPFALLTRTRLGNLVGITSVANEYGLIAGSYAATNGQYFRASNTAFELHGIDLVLWNAGVVTAKIDHAVPSIALGNPLPTGYGQPGIWMGYNSGSGTYCFFVGNTASTYIYWNGSTLGVVGAITVTGGNAAKTDFSNVTAAYAASSYGVGGPAAWVAPTVNVAAVNGTGLYMGANIMGYYVNGVGWKSYMDSAGGFYLSGTGSHSLSWDGTTLTIHGTINADSGNIGGWSITGGNITGAYGGLVSLNYSGLLQVGPSSSDVIAMTAYGATTDSGVRLWVGNAAGSTRLIQFRNDGSITAQTVAAGNCEMGYGGRQFLTNTGTAGYTFWGDGVSGLGSDSNGRMTLVGANGYRLMWDGTEFFPENPNAKLCGHPTFYWSAVWSAAFSNASDRRLKTDIVATKYGTEFLRALAPVEFTWRQSDARALGFIAQDVAAVAPTFPGLHFDDDGEATGLVYDALLAPVVRGFQELDARVAELERRIYAQ